MKLNTVIELLDTDVVTGKVNLDYEVYYAYGSDLLSDVLAFVKNNVLLLTGLVHPQVIRTAELMDIKAVVIVRGKKPSQEMVTMANQKGILLLTTNHSLFTACGILYEKGLYGEEIVHDEITL